MEYNATLKEKFAAHPQVKRIARHRQVPKHIYHERSQQMESRKKLKRKYDHFINKKIYACIKIFLIIFIFLGRKISANIQRKIVFRMSPKEKKMLSQKLFKLFFLFTLRFY